MLLEEKEKEEDQVVVAGESCIHLPWKDGGELVQTQISIQVRRSSDQRPAWTRMASSSTRESQHPIQLQTETRL